MRRSILSAIVLCCLNSIVVAADDEAAKNVAAWQGTWRAVSFLTDGKLSTDEQLQKISLEVKGTAYTFRNGSFSESGEYRFDVTKNPRQLDIVVGEGKDKGKVYLVIYQIEGDKLTICLQRENKLRPAEFTGAAGTGCVLEHWQRALSPCK